MNNLHIISAEFEALVNEHHEEKRKLHEAILSLRQECRKLNGVIKEQASFTYSALANPATEKLSTKPAGNGHSIVPIVRHSSDCSVTVNM